MSNFLKKIINFKLNFNINDLKKISVSDDRSKYVFVFLAIVSVITIYKFSTSQRYENKINFKNSLTSHEDFQSIKRFLNKKLKSPYKNFYHTVVQGETLRSILSKYDVNSNEIEKIRLQIKKHTDPNKINIGSELIFTTERNKDQKISVNKIIIPVSKTINILVYEDDSNNLVSEKVISKLYKKLLISENIINSSLYKSAMEVKMKPETIIEFARIFGFEIDFQRDIRKGDSFRILYEMFYDEDGKQSKTGSILFAYMSVNGKKINLYRFGKNKDYGYFNIFGKSVEKALMKTPINGARLSSSFGMRKHPISGFTKMHRGTDFAAPMGTPIMASGSGTILAAKWCGGGGNCVKIKHNSTYTTVYAHMKSFGKGIRIGRKVRQSQIIGYVGSTGISTGPHLHYEVIVNGKHVNSRTLKLPSGKVLKGNERKLFEIERIKTDVLISEMLSKQN
jgi:murein DD-endopeptidase MepM/ murein hydrolase activator NlpD